MAAGAVAGVSAVTTGEEAVEASEPGAGELSGPCSRGRLADGPAIDGEAMAASDDDDDEMPPIGSTLSSESES